MSIVFKIFTVVCLKGVFFFFLFVWVSLHNVSSQTPIKGVIHVSICWLYSLKGSIIIWFYLWCYFVYMYYQTSIHVSLNIIFIVQFNQQIYAFDQFQLRLCLDIKDLSSNRPVVLHLCSKEDINNIREGMLKLAVHLLAPEESLQLDGEDKTKNEEPTENRI